MSKVDPNKAGSRTPKVSPEDIEGDVALVTIAAYEEDEIEGRFAAKLFFDETGDKALFLNKTMLTALVERLGEESDKWIGQQIPIEVKKVSFKGEHYDKVYVVPADEWNQYLTAPKRSPRAKAAKGKGRGRK